MILRSTLWPCLFVLAAGSGAARAQAVTVEQNPSIRSALPDDGDPGGIRRWLHDRGVTFGAVLTSEAFSNRAGGLRRGTVFEGKLEAIVGIDFEKLAGWQGLTLFSNFFQIHGTGGVSRDLVGALNTVSNIEALPSNCLSELWLEQKFAGGLAGLRVGQLTTDSEFFNSQYFNIFVTSDWPTITKQNLPGGGPAYPLSTPGIRLRIDPTAETSMLLAVFNGDPAGAGKLNPELFNRHGLNFRVNDPPLVIAEAQYRYNQDPAATGRAGGIRLGAWRHFGQFDDQRFDVSGLSLANPLSTGAARQFRGTEGVYAVIDQQLYRPAGGDANSGISMFGRISATPSDRNLNDFYLDGGILFNGMHQGRPLDTFGVSFLYSHISDRARALDRDAILFSGVQQPLRDYELTFEFMYSAMIVPGWTLQPLLHYVIHPGGNIPDPNLPLPTSPIRDAVVVGLRSVVRY